MSLEPPPQPSARPETDREWSLAPWQDRTTSVAAATDGTSPIDHVPGAAAAAIAAIADVSGSHGGRSRRCAMPCGGQCRRACPASPTRLAARRFRFQRCCAAPLWRLCHARLIPARHTHCGRSRSRREAAADRQPAGHVAAGHGRWWPLEAVAAAARACWPLLEARPRPAESGACGGHAGAQPWRARWPRGRLARLARAVR